MDWLNRAKLHAEVWELAKAQGTMAPLALQIASAQSRVEPTELAQLSRVCRGLHSCIGPRITVQLRRAYRERTGNNYEPPPDYILKRMRLF